MARAISVKVATTKVIKALEAKLDASKKAEVTNEKKRKDFEKVDKAWQKEVAELAFKQIAKADVSAHENWRNDVNISIQIPASLMKLPAKPELQLDPELARYEVVEIENAIRILKMTDEEFVNASTFKQVAQYL